MVKRKRTILTIFAIVVIINVVISNFSYDTLSYFFQNDCQLNSHCLRLYLAGPMNHLNEDFLDMVREKYLIPPPTNPNRTTFDINSPPWKDINKDWRASQNLLKEVFSKELPKKFVEVGAINGDFFSKTLYLEKNLSWTGLLIEPDPRSFKELTKSRRNAWLSPLCISSTTPKPRRFLIHPVREELPARLKGVIWGRSKLYNVEDERQANYWDAIWVPCTPLSTILKAAELNEIGLLTISGSSDLEDHNTIKETLQNKFFDIKALLFHFPKDYLIEMKYPKINGYIIDVGRSLMEVKFYLKKKYCLLINETCDRTKACYNKYRCFGYLTVYSIKGH